jgi:hypothetical protein
VDLSPIQKRTLDAYEKDVDTTAKGVLAWIVSLFLILLAIVNSLSPKLHEIQRLEAKREGNVREQRRYIAERERLRLGNDAAQNDELTKRIDAIVAATEKRRAETTKQFVDLRKELGSVPTPLGAVTLPLRYLPVTWLCLCCGLMLFMSVKRRQHFQRLAGIIAAQKGPSAHATVESLSVTGPLWCAPLPRLLYVESTGSTISRVDLARALDWPDRGEVRTFVVWGAIAVLAFAWTWMARYAFLLSRYDSDPLVQLKLGIIVMALSVVAVVLVVQWCVAMRRKPSETQSPRVLSRRDWVRASAVGIAGLAVYIAAPRWALPAILRRDGRRVRIVRGGQDRPADPKYRGTFLHHRDSHVIHYIDTGGWHSERAILDYGRMTPVPRDVVMAILEDKQEPLTLAALLPSIPPARRTPGQPVPTEDRRVEAAVGAERQRRPRVHPRQRHALAECFALQLVSEGKREAAFDLLFGVLRQQIVFGGAPARQSYMRLVDLALRIGSTHAERVLSLQRLRSGVSVFDHARREAPLRGQRARPSTPWRTPFARARGFAGLTTVESLQI